MKAKLFIVLITIIFYGCSTTRSLNYFQNIPQNADPQVFSNEYHDYKVKFHDILYIDIKTSTPEGKVEDFLQGNSSLAMNYMQGESTQYLVGFSVDSCGNIRLPAIGDIHVAGETVPQIKMKMQTKVDSIFRHAYVDVKLLNFKYTVLGEARMPGTYVNYNNYITVLEAIGRAGGISDFGKRDNVLVIRTTPKGTLTFRINLKDKSLLSSEAYYLMPNDVIVIEPGKQKLLNLNLPTFSFIITTVTSLVTTTILLVNYLGK